MFSGRRWKEREKWFLQEHLELVQEISGNSEIITKFAKGEIGPPTVSEYDRDDRITLDGFRFEPCFIPFRDVESDYRGFWIREFDDLNSVTLINWYHDGGLFQNMPTAEQYLFREIEFAWECCWGSDRLQNLIEQIRKLYGSRAPSILECLEYEGDLSNPGKYELLKRALPIFKDRLPMTVMNDCSQFPGVIPADEDRTKFDTFIAREASELSRDFREEYYNFMDHIDFDDQMQKYFAAGEYSKAWYLLNSNVGYGRNETVVKWLNEFIEMTKTPVLKRLYTWWLTKNDFKSRVHPVEVVATFVWNIVFWPFTGKWLRVR